MTKSKRMIIRLLCVILLLGLLPGAAISAYNNEEGDALTWSYDAQTQTLTISGTGPMNDFSTFQHYYGEGNQNVKKLTNAPWYIHYSETKTVVLESGVTTVGKNAFYGFDRLTAVTIPDTVTRIVQAAFYDCSALTDLVIPDSVTEIGSEAFRGCKSLTAVVIPDSVTSIGEKAFYHCFELKEAVLSNNLNVIPVSAFQSCSALESITIPDSVTLISESAFNGCEGLKTIVWGNHVEEIGKYAFYCCVSLTNTTIPDSIKKIGERGFGDCTGLQCVTLPNGMTNVPRLLFENCTSLTRIEIPGSVEIIGNSAFSGCSSLASVTLPDSVKTIGSNAFSNTALTQATIPNSVETIGNSAFSGCGSLASVSLPDSVKTIGSDAFTQTALTQVTIPAGLSEIGRGAFSYCTALESVEIPGNVETIGDTAFQGCTALTRVSLASGVRQIGRYAFGSCTELTDIVFPDSVVVIRDSVLENCPKLVRIDVDPNNPVYHSAGNCVIETASKMLIAGCGTSVIPADGSVEIIGSFAFENCAGLKKADIPDCVEIIGTKAFQNCVGLTELQIGSGVTIMNDAFIGCTGLRHVELPGSLKTVDGFMKCSGLESVEISEGTEVVDGYAFGYCTSLKTVTLPNSLTTILPSAFYSCPGLTDVYYYGSRAEWDALEIYNGNQNLLNARIHYLNEIYTATFVVDGEVYATESFTVTQESIRLPDVPKKPGYTGTWSPYILNEQDITIKAIYTPIEYTATFIADDKIVTVIPFTVETAIFALPAVPPKEGCAGKWEPYTFNYDNLEIHAMYEPITYYATVIADGVTIAEIPFVFGQKSIQLPDVPKKEGHTGVWPSYTLPAHDITIEAVYTPLEYSVTYLVDGQSIGSGTIPYGNPIWQPRIPQKMGYSFSGWTPKVPATMPAEDQTFTAVFEPNPYTVTWIVDGAEFKKDTILFGETITAPTPEKEGYTFSGWDGEIPASMPAKDLTFRAVWEKLPDPPTITIKNFTATKPVDYKATITFTAVTENGPDDATVHWFIDGKDVGTGKTYTKDKATSSYTVQCKLMQGSAVLAESETETVNVNTGFFAKLIAFFKGLFGLLPTITQAFKETL